MINLFLTNESLKQFMEKTKISAETRSLILSKLDQMDEEERTKLFNFLKELYLLDMDEQESVDKIKKYLQK